jgi:hypothetical protein
MDRRTFLSWVGVGLRAPFGQWSILASPREVYFINLGVKLIPFYFLVHELMQQGIQHQSRLEAASASLPINPAFLRYIMGSGCGI